MKLKPDECIFVEPSCGDGRILFKFLSSLTSNLSELRIVGYDIDPHAVQASRRILWSTCSSSLSSLTSNNTTTVIRTVPIHCRDFLSTTIKDVLQDTSETTMNASDEANQRRHLIVLGGPPYSVNRGYGEHAIQRDLPKRFILHSLLQLRASVVVFILPRRCEQEARETYQDLIHLSLASSSSPSSPGIKDTNMCTLHQSNLNSNWFYRSEELPNSLFEFQGTWVKQPSILQIWSVV